MLNQDALHLFERTSVGARVKVRPQGARGFYVAAAPEPLETSRRGLLSALF